jgi:Mg2+-importing ATPase
LLGNFLSDIPALTIASDKVDVEATTAARKWDINYIKRFMIVFGLQSSLFDVATFVVLLRFFHTGPDQFRSGWFIESLFTQTLILLIIRTQRPFFKSTPSKYLMAAAVGVLLIATVIPFTSLAHFFDLQPLPARIFVTIIAIAMLYILVAEVTKQYLMKKL